MKGNMMTNTVGGATKCRVMCPDCQRQKMLFETEKKALNFLKFNADNLRYTTDHMRAYYCEACGGWHITSKEYSTKFEGRTDKLIEAYKKDKNNITSLDVSIFVDKTVEEIGKQNPYNNRLTFV